MDVDARNRLKKVKDTIVNRGLVFGSVAGLATYLASLSKWFNAGFELSFVTDLIFLGVIVLLTLRRKRLSTTLKSYVVIFAILGVVLVDIYEIGVLSANKVLLVLIPFFTFVALSKRETTYVSLVTLSIVAVLAALHIQGVLKVDLEQNLGVIAWSINLAMISVVAFLIVVMITQFNGAYEQMISNLEQKNQQLKLSEERLERYKTELEVQVEMRTAKLKKTNATLRRKKSETEEALLKLRRAQDELVKSEKLASLGMISSGIAHEINNPLTYIKGGIHGLETHIAENFSDEQFEHVKPMLDMANEGVNRAAGIVRSMNQYNRNAGAEQCFLPDIIGNCIQILGLGRNDDVAITSTFPEDFPTIRGSNGELHQLFMNLLTNALDAISDRGNISIQGEVREKAVLVTIVDDGVGMSSDTMKKLGVPFFTTKDVGEGTGLGLYIVSKILRDHQGTMKHFSEEGEGTEVVVKLPLFTTLKDRAELSHL